MNHQHDYTPRERILRLMLTIIRQPHRFTKKDLMARYGVAESTIKGDIQLIRNLGFSLNADYASRYRYYFEEEKEFKQFRDLLYFSEEEQSLLIEVIDKLDLSEKRGERLLQKLNSLYDYNKLGHRFLRRPHLNKIDALLLAKKEKKTVLLSQYHSSSSNVIKDRVVEPFHIDADADTLQAFDVEVKALRHFRISRIRRVIAQEDAWVYENHHVIRRTDPFRIVDNEQIQVHLRIKIGAYNELIERFPLTRAYLDETEDPEIYDFQCNVNHQFYGLTNFILGFHHQLVEVVAPDALIDHLNERVKNMKF